MTGQKQPTHARKAADNNIWEIPRSPNNKKTCKNKGVPKLSAESQQQKKQSLQQKTAYRAESPAERQTGKNQDLLKKRPVAGLPDTKQAYRTRCIREMFKT